MLLLIDNYDSFTYNVARYFQELGQQVQVLKNDAVTVQDIERMQPDYLVISPGPGGPAESGISCQVIRTFAGRTPILGICLGHQCIAEVFGGQVVSAGEIIHGKTSAIHHAGQGLFNGLPSPFAATRYHSLAVDRTTLPQELQETAWTASTERSTSCIMGIKHRSLPVEGVQFHPESILSEHGHKLFDNFIQHSWGRSEGAA